MYNQKKIEKKYFVLIGAIVIAILLGLIAHIVTTDRSLNPLEKAVKDTVLLSQKIIYQPVKFVKDKIKDYREKQNIYEKYKILKNKVKETDLIQAEKKELEHQLKKMKKTLDLNHTLVETEYLNATVVNRNLGYWYNTITIDKGSHNGVKKDMPVIVSDGVIGKITKVSNFNSTVKLLTSEDINNKISVKIEVGDKYVYGLLSGYQRKGNVFTVEGIADNIEIPKDSIVTTTGMGDNFPSGIMVGKVKKVKTDHFDLAKTVEVTSSVDFDDLSYVTILKRKEGSN